jgi:hypothetical protein
MKEVFHTGNSGILNGTITKQYEIRTQLKTIQKQQQTIVCIVRIHAIVVVVVVFVVVVFATVIVV